MVSREKEGEERRSTRSRSGEKIRQARRRDEARRAAAKKRAVSREKGREAARRDDLPEGGATRRCGETRRRGSLSNSWRDRNESTESNLSAVDLNGQQPTKTEPLELGWPNGLMG